MTLWDIIPTCDDPMSCYTLVAFAIVVTGNIVGYSLLARWTLNGFKEMKEALADHDDYIDDTSKIINQMGTDIAVVAACIKNIENDGTETRTAIAEINRTLLDKLT